MWMPIFYLSIDSPLIHEIHGNSPWLQTGNFLSSRLGLRQKGIASSWPWPQPMPTWPRPTPWPWPARRSPAGESHLWMVEKTHGVGKKRPKDLEKIGNPHTTQKKHGNIVEKIRNPYRTPHGFLSNHPLNRPGGPQGRTDLGSSHQDRGGPYRDQVLRVSFKKKVNKSHTVFF